MIAYLPAAVAELIVPPKETPPQKLPCFGCVLDTIDRQRKIDAQMDNRSSRALKCQHKHGVVMPDSPRFTHSTRGTPKRHQGSSVPGT